MEFRTWTRHHDYSLRAPSQFWLPWLNLFIMLLKRVVPITETQSMVMWMVP